MVTSETYVVPWPFSASLGSISDLCLAFLSCLCKLLQPWVGVENVLQPFIEVVICHLQARPPLVTEQRMGDD
jgi:hypothetical protein